MDEISKEVLNQTKGVAVEVYKDVVSPSAKPIGEVLSFLPRTIKVAFGGWEKWLVNKEESIRLTADAIKKKVEQIPEDKLVEPEAHIAIPAIQQLCYCQDSEELRDLYANLLTSSMNADKKWQVHPAYVDIVKQLCPDEAKYLKAMPEYIIPTYPLIDVLFSVGEGAKGANPIVSNFTDYNLDKLEHPENTFSIDFILFVFNFDNSDKDSKDLQFLNIESKYERLSNNCNLILIYFFFISSSINSFILYFLL